MAFAAEVSGLGLVEICGLGLVELCGLGSYGIW
jgi:hypothetical protein